MRNFSNLSFNFFHIRIWKPYALCLKAITCFILLNLFVLPSKSFGQAGDLSQIRNGNGKTSQQGVLDTCGSCWVNGNAGSSNAHLREGYSIPYRSILTLLTPGTCYEYEIGYDTYHSAMAIDYLTHYQRLEPHGPFGHQAEIIRPLILEVGGVTTTIDATLPPDTYPIPMPQISNITSGAYQQDGTTPKNIQNQPQTSFNGLPANERVMTCWNGDIQHIYYVSQAPITIGGADAETKLRIRFVANSSTVVLAWGGHIASRLDWGYSGLDNKGNPIPLSAGGISGSPYHMRQKAMYTVDCNSNPVVGTNLVVVSGFGNQDRSLAAAAVFPPPDCPTVPSQTICAGSSFSAFTIQSPQANVTYTWSFGTNTVGAAFAGNATSATGNSVTVVKSGGGSFTTSGSFALNITAVLNAVPQECLTVATGTVLAPSVTATVASNATIGTGTGCDISIDRAIGNVVNLTATAGGSPATPFTYQWSDDDNPNGNFGSATSSTTNYTVTANGTFIVKVVVTDAFGCTAQATKTICVTGSTPQCIVNGPGSICPGTTNNYIYDPDNDQAANAIPANFTALWTLENNTNGASISGSATGNTVTVVSSGGNCNSAYRIKITLTSTSGLITTNCYKDVSVVDQTAPQLSGCPNNVTVDFCSIPAPAAVTATDNCPATNTQILVTFLETRTNGQNGCSNVITRTWSATDACGNTNACSQTITIVDQDAPLITCPPSVTIECADALNDYTKTGYPFASDNCGISTVFYTDNGNTDCGNTFTRTWKVVDNAGNTATCTQSITREADETPGQQNTNSIRSNTETARTTSQQNAELNIKAYPNPFNDQVNFRFVPVKSGIAKLELYDMTGRRLATVQIGYVQAGIQRSFNYRVPALKRVSMFYKLSIGDQSGKGMLISGSKNE
jgi:hypothetical protein